jgi:hypothetical protein
MHDLLTLAVVAASVAITVVALRRGRRDIADDAAATERWRRARVDRDANDMTSHLAADIDAIGLAAGAASSATAALGEHIVCDADLIVANAAGELTECLFRPDWANATWYDADGNAVDATPSVDPLSTVEVTIRGQVPERIPVIYTVERDGEQIRYRTVEAASIQWGRIVDVTARDT